jgi:outer membrane immunogenic protein
VLYPDVLSFVSAGFTEAKFSDVGLLDQGIGPRVPPETLAAQTYNGWFVGGGVESMIAAFPGLSVRSEYRFADYGAKDVAIFGVPDAFAHIHPFVQTVRTELVYRFATH